MSPLTHLAALACAAGLAIAQEPGRAPREFRAAWIATVQNIDWPSKKGLPVAAQQQELTAILDRARAIGLNALILQVRPACDAFYQSPHEPWSEWLTGEQGRAPDPLWDPLQFAVDGAHARGLELHAWFNPYRAKHARSGSALAEQHVARATDLCVRYGDYLWLDPGRPGAQERTLRAILDVVTRYDVDGVHIDDYFYPYPEKGAEFPDDESFAAARRAGYRGTRPDWRRQNVDRLVQAIHAGVHAKKPWVKFGISPFGIARPGFPAGIVAGIDQYAHLYADVQKWLREGWCDYLSPQLYWPIAQEPQSYVKLLRWWPTVNRARRHLWIGNYTGQVGSKGWPLAEILAQVELARGQDGVGGNVHFSMRALMQDRAGVATALQGGPYATRALVPTSPWLDAQAPAPPVLEQGPYAGGWRVQASVAGDEAVRFFALYVQILGRWQLADVRGEGHAFVLPARPEAVAVTAIDRAGNESEAARQ